MILLKSLARITGLVLLAVVCALVLVSATGNAFVLCSWARQSPRAFAILRCYPGG